MAILTQDKLNTEMRDAGKTRYWNTVTTARANEEQTRTRFGKTLLSASIMPMADKFRSWVTENETKGAGRKAVAYRYLKDISPEVVALLTAKSIIDSIGLSKRLTAIVNSIVLSIEDEIRFKSLRENHPGLMRKLEAQLDRCNSDGHRRTVIVLAANRAGIQWNSWPKAVRGNIGTALVDMFCESTQLTSIVMMHEGTHRVNYLAATEKTIEWINNYHEHAELLDPVWLPMVEKPAEWTTPFLGGYNAEELVPLSMVKKTTREHLTRLAGAQMPDVYATVNALQNTPWQVNTRVLETMKALWDAGVACGGIPSRNDKPLPPRIPDMDTDEKALKAWKKEAALIHESNARTRSLRVAAVKLLHLATKFSNVERFYFPYQLDFRGRIYSIPAYLSPQGDDQARGLLTFADGCPINDDADAEWLKIYGAGLYGVDKVPFEDRKAWVDAHREDILAVDADPLATNFWRDCDDPFKFLAWCFEWAGWLRHGPGYVSHLPVCVDGTNNGLQLLALLTRDEVAGVATNVLPSSKPQDIYGNVAEGAKALMRGHSEATEEEQKPVVISWEAVRADLEHSGPEIKGDALTSEDVKEIAAGKKSAPEEVKAFITESSARNAWQPPSQRELAQYWLSVGINRKTTKRPVMVLPYGGTFTSCREYVGTWYKSYLESNNLPMPDIKEFGARVHYLSLLVWESIDSSVQRPRQAMLWLQQVAGLYHDAGLPVRWTTPTGFIVEQAYKVETVQRIKTTLSSGVQLRLTAWEPDEKRLDRRRQKNGMSPNYVHSLDASALMRTVALCKNVAGIKSFCMIHDSYGTHSSKMHELAAILRHVFAEMFSTDLLGKLREEAIAALPAGTEVPPVPEFGYLEPSKVRESEFFFA